MSSIAAILKRDLLIAVRSGGAWLHSLLFFVAFVAVAAIALGGDNQTLRPLAPALIWFAVIMSALLSFDRLFQTDSDDGNLEQIKISGTPLSSYVIGKCVAHWLLIVLPLLLCLPLVSILLGLSVSHFGGLFFSVLIASPALIAYGAFSGACLVGYKSSGVLLIMLTIPVIIPLMIFGIAAVDGYENAGLFAAEFRALLGLTMISCVVAIPAGTAALNAITE